MSSADMKSAIKQQLQSESAMNNARILMEKLSSNCFDKCVPSPGSTLTSNEQSCLNTCMEKYISLWNTTSRAYIARIGQEREKGGLVSSDPTIGASSGNGGIF
ncbi:mitochondrial intermembrane space translocase subunit Tim [Arthroderma uncinatum]|uniref:mitochondrial intermembrane space translocase subunit Tim n=1 Tax=Arthroderma uncinatum TaxID=74035 RepID=UPI00144AC6B5|nr:mitochondrial intermembrane space translocase subunit Tim [Arthroderma uncinatum]KAF3482741.1 mitochondrial intermembrane space translocase subunit Tim [Arthroderma uncinatum]